MKQVCMELWVENRTVLLCVKIFMMLLMILSGVFIRGFPYPVLGVFLMISLETTSARLDSQIEYLVPRTGSETKKIIVRKSMLVAGAYSLVNTVSYVLTIQLYEPYHWDRETILFIFIMTVFIFLFYFHLRIETARMLTHNDRNADVDKTGSGVWRAGACSFLNVFYILFFIFRKFGHVGFPVVFGEHQWKISMVIAGFIFALNLYHVKKECLELDNQEYCGWDNL